MSIRRLAKVLSAVALLVLTTAEATASILMFTHAGSGSGTLAGVSFPESDFVITAAVDTDNRVPILDMAGFSIPHTTANISIAGLGIFDFLTPTKTFVNNNNSIVGFGNLTTGLDLFDGPIDPQFGIWDMLGPIGPITGPGDVFATWDLPFRPLVETTGGDLVFIRGTPTATFTAIPEPTTLLLLALGGLLVIRRRR